MTLYCYQLSALYISSCLHVSWWTIG